MQYYTCSLAAHLSTCSPVLLPTCPSAHLVIFPPAHLSTWPRPKARQRLADKLEFLDWDPTIGRQVLYREDKKIVSLREEKVKQVTRLKISNNIHNKWPTMALEPASD